MQKKIYFLEGELKWTATAFSTIPAVSFPASPVYIIHYWQQLLLQLISFEVFRNYTVAFTFSKKKKGIESQKWWTREISFQHLQLAFSRCHFFIYHWNNSAMIGSLQILRTSKYYCLTKFWTVNRKYSIQQNLPNGFLWIKGLID